MESLALPLVLTDAHVTTDLRAFLSILFRRGFQAFILFDDLSRFLFFKIAFET